MTAGMHDHFAPRGKLTNEQLRAYAEGRLSEAERHVVETHLEQDELAREALEGLRLPGALAGMEGLASHRPGSGAQTSWFWLAGSAALLLVTVIVWDRVAPVGEAPLPILVVNDGTSEATLPEPTAPLIGSEIFAAVEIPETLRIGHAGTDRHARAMQSEALARDIPEIERIEARTPTLDSMKGVTSARPERAKRKSMQLMFLHDLKLIHPKELYTTDPMLLSDGRHVSANFADSNAQRSGEVQQRRMRYIPFMDAALDKFIRNDHKGCLEELRFLLDQYPDDVNALFYAGLCSYNLGMDKRAEEFLRRAASHPIDVFDEEAQWYHALSLERLGEHARARAEFQRISDQAGFYAERARARLGRN